jgi:general secretion pathway protein H
MIRDPHKSPAAGYTLVELLVVVSIVGLLAVTAIPLVSASRPALLARQASRMLGEDLAAARQSAITRDSEVRVLLSTADGSYSIAPFGLRRRLARGLSLAFSGAERDEIDFYPDGSTSGGTITLSAVGATAQVSVPWPAGQIALHD